MRWLRAAERGICDVADWMIIFLLIVFGEAAALAVSFGVLRGLASWAGISPDVNTARRTLISLVTIIPVAGFAGFAFFVIPFWGPIFGTVVSGYVAVGMFADKYDVDQKTAAKVVLPTVLAIYIVTGFMIYLGFQLL